MQRTYGTVAESPWNSMGSKPAEHCSVSSFKTDLGRSFRAGVGPPPLPCPRAPSSAPGAGSGCPGKGLDVHPQPAHTCTELCSGR